MGNITLNKPSGGQLTIAPEDGTSNETVEIPSVGVGKVLQVREMFAPSQITSTAVSFSTLIEGAFEPKQIGSTIYVEYNGNVDIYGGSGIGAVMRVLVDGTYVQPTGSTNDLVAYQSGHGYTLDQYRDTHLVKSFTSTSSSHWIQVDVAKYSSNGTSATWSTTWSTHRVRIMEVAA